ncbi:D-alanyl-D-alanine carboxypeptidase [uncultured Sutterella sp.]|uniref:D-alanyl-D-alanine carboxypeptidase/D-alanyl-D-alanine-endopeptidase n=1 Tax=uncultured Sutterella sp. TaxID=286133 RepID=UPI00260695BF|nr:D-alanyl-D-alanine carboxypeptidase [uncultured Sutterella sp.]
MLSLPALSLSAGAAEAPAAAEASAGEPDAGPQKEDDGAEPEAAGARALPRRQALGRTAAPERRAELTKLPDKLLQAARRLRVDPAGIAVSVVPVEDPKRPVLSWRADAMEPPASTAKLVTTLAALEVLGSSYRWRTNFYVREMPDRNGLLRGGLFIRGGGDPALVLEDFALEVDRLAQKGIRRIDGNIVIDRSHFNIPNVDPGAFDGRRSRPYNLQPDAALLNYRNLSFELTPDVKAGVARVVVFPPLAGVSYPKTIRLGKGGCGDWKSALAFRVNDLGKGKKRVVFNGRYPSACGVKNFNVIAFEANEYFERLFRALWERDGRTWRGKVVSGKVPEDGKLFLTRLSPTLGEITALTNKWSNNPMARHIFLTLGARRVEEELEAKASEEEEAAKASGASKKDARSGDDKRLQFPRGATLGDARAELSDWMTSRGIPASEIIIDNGSGLSRTSHVSARAMTDLLSAGWNGPYMPEYLASLPITGRDGTMVRRKAAPEEGRIKTGYLENVRSIGGYVHALDGRRYAVYASVTGAKNVPGGIKFLDAVIEWVYAGE